MVDDELISVIIPATRYDKFLRAAVESILRDGWSHLEIIVVLDGEEKPVPLWLLLPQVTVTSTGHRSGSAAAINLGINRSRGKYVARLDADDLSRPGRFRKQVAFLQDNPGVLLVGGGAELINADGLSMGSYNSHSGPDVRSALLRRNPFVHSSFLLRREILEVTGLYDETCTRMQDYEFLLRLAMVGELAIIDEVLIGYRVHDSQNSKQMQGFFKLMYKLSRRKRQLARRLGRSTLTQTAYDVVYASAQYARYRGWRAPRYLNNTQP